MQYPINISKMPNGTFMVKFSDIPEAVTCGETEDEAVKMAQDALLVAISGLMDLKKPIPEASRAKRGQKMIIVPPMAATKIVIYQAMFEQKVTQLELARRLHADGKQVRRILDLDHNSKMDQLEAALQVLGLRMCVEFQKAA